MEKEEAPIHQRLNRIIADLEFGVQARFAERIGVPTGTIGDIFGKKKSKPGFELTGKILQAYPEISERWLLLGVGEMLKPTESPKKIFVTPDLPMPGPDADLQTGFGTSKDFGKNASVHKARIEESLQLYENRQLSTQRNSVLQSQSATTVDTEGGSHSQAQAQSHALLADVTVIALRYVSFEARASFFEELRQNLISDNFETVPHRLPSTMAEADYADAVVFEIEERTMEPSLRYGQQVIAWPMAEGKWEYLHNIICLVAYDDMVALRAIRTNELFDRDGLTLHTTSGAGGSFTVARKNIHSIWEAREFYGYVPVLLLS